MPASACQAEQDRADLGRFGYAQELFRNMGGFSNFAISFSIISILTGAVTLFGYGLEMGGPLEMTLGWPLATVFMLAVAASMAELCSAYPTSGAMYHWAADLGSPVWGWFVAWLNIVGLVAAQAGINYSCAQFVLPFLGIPSTYGNLLWMFAFILLTQALLNHYGIKLVAILNDLSVTVHIVGVAVLVLGLFWLAPRQPVSFLWEATNSNGRSPYWWAFVLGLLQAHWTYTGFDASAHLAEETADPRRHAPWGVVLSVAVAGVVGYFLILSLTLAIRSIPAALAARDPQGNSIPAAIAILESALGGRAGNALAALASMAMWFCGLSCVTSASRAVYSLARDHGTPAAGLLRWVSPRHGTPAPAVWLFVAASFAAMVWTGAVPIVTSLSTVALYAAYIIPVILAYRARRRGSPWPQAAVWSLGRWGGPVNVVAIVYTVFICVVLVMPPNLLAGKTFLGLLAGLAVLYAAVARRKYKGPEWSRAAGGPRRTRPGYRSSVMTALETVKQQLKPGKLFINGRFEEATSGKTIDVVNPATGELLTTAPDAGPEDVDRAVAAARASFERKTWRGLDPSKKEKILWTIGDILARHRDELCLLESMENGKTVREAGGADVEPAIDAFRYYAGWVRKIYGDTIPVDGPYLNYTLREPVGVVGGIVPWNYPLLLATWKVVPALACGCSMVLKPSEMTPLTALKLAEYCLEAGVPEGVVNVVTGYGWTAGDALARHMDVDKISFTGSIRTARALLKASAESNLKRLSLELGGKSPNIIFPDCDLEAAVKAAFWGIFANKGEVCSAGSRLLLHADIHDRFLDVLVDRAKKMKVGDPLDRSTMMGSQISAAQLERILGYIRSGVEEGAKVLCGGERDTEGAKSKGFFVKPTVFSEVNPEMKIAQEEIFGPVLAAIRFRDANEAVAIANGTIYGLVSAVWTRDIQLAHRLAAEIKAGSVWINTYNGFDSGSPFGGYKQSGFGRDLGAYALDQYTNVKSVWVAL